MVCVMHEYEANTFVLSIGFFGVFLAFNAAQGLTTSLDGDLGNICLGVLYGTFSIFCVAAPRIVNNLGPSLAMTMGAATYVVMVFSNIKPSYYLSIPANFLVGLGGPLLWTGQGVYLGRCALRYAKDTKTNPELATSQFNGKFFSYFQANGTVGTIITSIVLRSVSNEGLDDAKTYLFIGLGIACGVGVAILFFIPPVATIGDNENADTAAAEALGSVNIALGATPTDVERQLAAALKESGAREPVTYAHTMQLAFFEPKMRLLIPFLMYNGMSLGFMFGDYTRYVISPGLGANVVGYGLAAFYGMNMIITYVYASSIAEALGRRGLLCIAGMFQSSYLLWLCFYTIPQNYLLINTKWVEIVAPVSTDYAWIFFGAITFALGDSVYESQPSAILQTYFVKNPNDSDAAMGNVKLFQSLGFSIQFILGFVLKDNFLAKLIILIVMFVVANACVVYLDKYVEPVDKGAGEAQYILTEH